MRCLCVMYQYWLSLSFREGIRFAGQAILLTIEQDRSGPEFCFGARTASAGCAVREISPGFSLTLPSIYHQLKRTGDQPRRLLPVGLRVSFVQHVICLLLPISDLSSCGRRWFQWSVGCDNLRYDGIKNGYWTARYMYLGFESDVMVTY